MHGSESDTPKADGVASDFAARPSDRNSDIALLAHELRNQLAPIRYAIAALEKPDKSPAQQQHALSVMKRQAAHMSRLLDDLLDVSRVGRGELQLNKGSVELAMVLGSAIEAARPLLDRKQHVLSMQLPHEPLRVWADSFRLVQVFSNLLINAAKYTDAGGRIEINVQLMGECAVVTVRDSGIGISPELIPRIFGLFTQGAPTSSRSEGGLGIGLALVHGIVSLHGGSVTASSDGLGRGSAFCVSIPVGVLSATAPPVPAPQVRRRYGVRVLVVDDNRDVADTCAMLIELAGHRVETAYTAADGAVAAERMRPQVIFTDIGLPDIDGFEFARGLRQLAWGQTVVLVAVTGWAEADLAGTRDITLFDHYLTKPIDPAKIESVLQELAAQQASPCRGNRLAQ